MIHDDTIIIAVQGSRKQTKQTSSKTGSVSTNACPAPWRCGYRMQDSVKEAFDTVFVPVEDIWLGFADTTEACEGTLDSQ